MPDELDLGDLRAELAELRDAVNTSRVIAKGLHNQARNAVRLMFALDDQLGRFDSQLQQLQRQATEAQRNDSTTEESSPETHAVSALARAV